MVPRLHVRTDGVIARRPVTDLAVEGGAVRVHADTPVALHEDGPFAPLALALQQDGVLRDELARAIPIPSLRHHARVRAALAAVVLIPCAMLLELDRELVIARHASAIRAAIDLILVAFVGFELSRRTPRSPAVCALALAAIGLRWALVAARLCARGVHVSVYLAAALALGASVVFLVRVPSQSRVALELASKLGLTRSELFAARERKEPPPALVAAAVGAAAGLPAILHLTRSVDAGLLAQATAFLGFAALAPIFARRAAPPPATEPAERPRSVRRTWLGIVTGLVLAAAAVTTARLFLDGGMEVARCVARLDAEARLARAAESSEVARAIAKVRASTPLVILASVVFPFAEERIYRGLLLDVLARRYGRAYGLFASSLAFGVAHLGIYHVALYQTVLLGLAFGVAYLEGGLLAAFVVHATWNVLQLAG